jgi:hypothetical protein
VRISEFNHRYVTMEIDYEEVRKINALDTDSMGKLCELLLKYERYMDDCRKIKTKELLAIYE